MASIISIEGNIGSGKSTLIEYLNLIQKRMIKLKQLQIKK